MKRRYFLEDYARKSYTSVVHVYETYGGSELRVSKLRSNKQDRNTNAKSRFSQQEDRREDVADLAVKVSSQDVFRTRRPYWNQPA